MTRRRRREEEGGRGREREEGRIHSETFGCDKGGGRGMRSVAMLAQTVFDCFCVRIPVYSILEWATVLAELICVQA